VTSLVFDQSENIKIVNKQNIGSNRTAKSDISKMDFSELTEKVAEHEGMLGDLIDLTKTLSKQIKNLLPEWS
jgi:hypothetical protein